MSKYKGLFTFDEDNHRYVPVSQADGIIDTMDYEQDSEPAEPLIKDPKIRKAVRAWAEANRVAEARYSSCHDAECEFNARDDENKSIVFIGNFTEMNEELDSSGRTIYTIAELCGSEEIEILEPTFTTIEEKAKLKEKE